MAWAMLALAALAPQHVLAAKLPRNAPPCAPPGARLVFVSPMGEPFRAPPGQAYPSAAWFSGADKDGNGELARAEFVADAARFFAQLDTNHDGRLTPDEIAVYETDIAPEVALFASRPSDFYERDNRRRHEPDAVGRSSDYGGAMGAGAYSWLNRPEPVMAADDDLDRVVTASEFATAASKTFDLLNAAGHDAIKLSSLTRTIAQMASEGPCRPAKPNRH